VTETSDLPVADPLAADSRLVVGVDASHHAVAALRWALREAVLRSATVEAVHVWPPPVAALPFGATLTAPGEDAELDAAARNRLNELVDEALAELADDLAGYHPDRAVPDVLRTVMPGAAAMTLIDVAKDADLLVVGSHGRTGLRRLMLGSVALACVQHAACPVTVVRLPD
jgi:nucleotide-binding universal stress UspA family protein